MQIKVNKRSCVGDRVHCDSDVFVLQGPFLFTGKKTFFFPVCSFLQEKKKMFFNLLPQQTHLHVHVSRNTIKKSSDNTCTLIINAAWCGVRLFGSLVW